jgi:hypothetical protein
MTDDELIGAFESAALPADEFPHAAHVRVAWCYLNRVPLLLALARFRSALQRFAAAQGKPDRYHETITIAYMLLIAERLGHARGASWEQFASANPDLLTWNPSILSRFYTDEVLSSERARGVFVLPNLDPSAHPNGDTLS